ncbi:recombinase family protein [Motilibacter deserti]|uniref:Recombinase family protein n=1 Tax=Motilibacter deserti TaxID=2714956 RepID=A0ABX0GSJ4_9ACTN|nr:recombinase family protein [Motilibacter deserti]NHC12677.1 recombinase family protein [Motilibacter deserti]
MAPRFPSGTTDRPATSAPLPRRVPGRKAKQPRSATAGDQTQPKVIRVAFYRRASTEEANQPFSLDAQKLKLESFVPLRDGWVQVADYVERASGKDIAGRPEMRKLLTHAAQDKFDLVLVARVDRWSRSLADLLDTVDLLKEDGVDFASATEEFETRTAMGNLILAMLGSFAQFERSMIIDRITRGIHAKVHRGIPLTRRVGYGLRVDADHVIEADPDTIGVVRRIFDEYVHGARGTRAIARGLDEDGITGPGTKGWSPEAVARVLGNASFIGYVPYGDQWLDGQHDAIIDPDLFRAAEGLRAKRAEPSAAASASRDFPFSGTVRCGRCGGAYVGTSGTGSNGRKHRYYSCVTARRRGAAACGGPNLPAGEFEELMVEAILASYSDTDVFSDALTAHRERRDDRQGPASEELAAVRASLAAKQRTRQRYQDDYEAGRLSAERYESRAAELDDELTGLTSRTAALELELAGNELPVLPTPAELAAWREALAHAVRTGPVALRKELFSALVESVTVHDSDDIRPALRLYHPDDAPALPTDKGAGESLDMANNGVQFARRRPRWS